MAYFRDLLVFLALAAGLAMARRRDAAALAFAVAWAVLAVGFWTVALARPYGVLQDEGATRWAADVSVAAHALDDGGFLAGEPSAHPLSSRFARRLGALPVLLAPSLLPVTVLPAIALVIALTRRGRAGALAAILWMAASTLDLDVARGVGLLPALWPMTMGAHPGIALSDLPGILVFDALPWLVLGAWALRSARDPGALTLVVAGALGVVLAALGVGSAVVSGALYRAGLVLAAAPLLARLCEGMAGVVQVPLPRGRAWPVDGAALRGAIVAIALAGSFPTWWDAPRLDPVMRDSLEPIPAALAESMAWVRDHTDPAATFVAGEDYAAAVAVLGGRRVLRAPSLATAGDEERRVRAERAVLSGRAADALISRYGVRYALLAPGQFRGHGLPEPWPVETAGAPLVHRNPSGLRVYALGAARPIMTR
jgi:hypothetical protein